jgi:taurine dioxygenase
MSSLAGKQGPRYRHIADDAEPYETIAVEKLTPIIGAEISGVDLAATLSNRTMDEIHRALAENLVIFFRDQAHHAGRASRFRPPVRRAAYPSRGAP